MKQPSSSRPAAPALLAGVLLTLALLLAVGADLATAPPAGPSAQGADALRTAAPALAGPLGVTFNPSNRKRVVQVGAVAMFLALFILFRSKH